MKDDLVGITEIAELLGISRQRVHVISKSDEQFPEPRAHLAAGLIWNKSDVEMWARRTGRLK